MSIQIQSLREAVKVAQCKGQQVILGSDGTTVYQQYCVFHTTIPHGIMPADNFKILRCDLSAYSYIPYQGESYSDGYLQPLVFKLCSH